MKCNTNVISHAQTALMHPVTITITITILGFDCRNQFTLSFQDKITASNTCGVQIGTSLVTNSHISDPASRRHGGRR